MSKRNFAVFPVETLKKVYMNSLNEKYTLGSQQLFAKTDRFFDSFSSVLL